MEDSGKRMEYPSGALREPPDGKGRFDLISPFGMRRVSTWTPDDKEEQKCPAQNRRHSFIGMAFYHINEFRIGDTSTDHLAAASRYILYGLYLELKSDDEEDDSFIGFVVVHPKAWTALAKWYELGSKKHGDRNWEKGMSYTRLFDSAIRHLIRYSDGGRTEDHLSAIVWNLFAYMHYESIGLSEFNDLPIYSHQESKKSEYAVDMGSYSLTEEEARNGLRSMASGLNGYVTNDLFKSVFMSFRQTEGKKRIIAVDFDGCLCEDEFPEIGNPNYNLIDLLIHCQNDGSTLVLWTCREGEKLEEAVCWCRQFGLEFDYVNVNPSNSIYGFGNNSRKIAADIYIDCRGFRIRAGQGE